MKPLKYILYFLFLIILMVFTSEMYLLNMDSFETEYICTTMYQPADISVEDMICDIEKEAILNNLKVFAVARDLESSYQTGITVYGMEGVREILEENSHVSEGDYHSILTGDTTFRFDDFSSITDLDEIDSFYLIGSMSDARNFKSALIDTYSGNFPKEGYVYLHAAENITGVWLTGLLFFVLFCIFEVSVLKKETALRAVLGSSLFPSVLKNVIPDTVFYLGSFAVLYNIIRYRFGISSDFYGSISCCCLVILCLSDFLIFMSLLRTDYKRHLSMAKSGKTIIGTGYVLRVVMSAIIVLCTTLFISMLSQYAVYKSQEHFFTDMKDYSYVSLSASDETLESTESAMEALFAGQDKQGNVFLNVYLDQGMFTGKPCLLFNSGASDYLRERIPELKNADTAGKICMVVPESVGEEGISDLEFLMEMYLYDNRDYEVITYKESVSVIGMTDTSRVSGNYYRNPLIILDGTAIENYYNGMYILQSAHIRLTDAQWEEFAADYDLSERISHRTNALSNYERMLSVYRRSALMALALLCALIILNIIITWTIVRLICTANAIEIAVKTTLGYGIAGKYRMLLFLNLVTILINGAVCIWLGNILFSGAGIYTAAGILVIILFDLAVTVFSVQRWEKRSVVKVLKGSAI